MDINKTVGKKYFRIGMFGTISAVIVIAIAVLINLIISAFPEKYTKLDTTAGNIYSIGDETIDIVKAVDCDIVLYLVAEEPSSTLQAFLERYEDISSHIKVKELDPVLHPVFSSESGESYNATDLEDNSVIVSSSVRDFTVLNSELYTSKYSDEELYYYQMYGQSVQNEQYFNGESEITGAIQNVALKSLPKVYALTGHGETAVDENILGYINKDNISLEDSFKLAAADSVPEDADCIMLNNPTSDITAAELEMLTDYIDDGGEIILMSGYAEYTDAPADFTNLDTLAEYFGLSTDRSALVCDEGTNGNLSGYYHYLLPTTGDHALFDLMESTDVYIVAIQATPIYIAEENENGEALSATATPLLTTTDDAYLKVGTISTVAREDGDTTGKFNVGAVSEDSVSGAKMVWYAIPFMTNYNVDQQYAGGGNSSLLLSTLGWMLERESSVSIASKILTPETLTVPDSAANMWMTITTIILPVAFAAVGLVIWLGRKRRA